MGLGQQLLYELKRRGVRLEVQSGRLMTKAPPGAITPELEQRIRTHKQELKQLADQAKPLGLPLLPVALVGLVKVAVSPGLNYPASLAGGFVSDLGTYVLESAALYAAGIEPERQLETLWEARKSWNP